MLMRGGIAMSAAIKAALEAGADALNAPTLTMSCHLSMNDLRQAQAAAAIAAFHAYMADFYFREGRRGLGHTHKDIAAAVERAGKEGA